MGLFVLLTYGCVNESRALIDLGQTPVLIYTEQVAQFRFRPKQVLEGVLIEFPEKSWTASRISERNTQEGVILQ